MLLGAWALGTGASACGTSEEGDETGVAARGAEVMPFDLEATTHRFEPTDAGLVETVVADDPGDDVQIELIRSHLAGEEQRFEVGDYGDPATIHGDDMPGLAELEAGAANIDVAYEDTGGGARLTFTSDDAVLIEALRRWGEAQTSDHGQHAAGSHG